MNELGDKKYLTGTVYMGSFNPMGFAKDGWTAIELAKLHKHLIVEFKVVGDYRINNGRCK